MDEKPTEGFQVRIKGRAGAGDITMESCNRQPDQEDQGHESLHRQRGAASCSQTLVLTGDFSQPNISWTNNTAEHRQSTKFLECLDEYFQAVEEPGRRGAVADLILTNKERVCGGFCDSVDVKLKGCSDHEMVEFKMLGIRRREHSKFTSMEFTRADLACSGVCFLEYRGIKPWRGAQGTWLIVKDHLFQAHEQCIPTKRKSGKLKGDLRG